MGYYIDFRNMLESQRVEALEHFLKYKNSSTSYNERLPVLFKIAAILGDDRGYQRAIQWFPEHNAYFKSEWKGIIRNLDLSGNYEKEAMALMSQAYNLGWRPNNDNYQINSVKSQQLNQINQLQNKSRHLQQNLKEYESVKDLEKLKKQLWLFHHKFDTCTVHPYAQEKRIQLNLYPQLKVATGFCYENGQLLKDNYGRNLIQPTLKILLQDAKTGEEKNIQSINYKDIYEKNEFDKRYVKGATKKGVCYFLNSEVHNVEGQTRPKDYILIGEGFATMASIYQVLNKQERDNCLLVMACDADNLAAVGMGLRLRFPMSHIIYCADNDFDMNKQNNCGYDAAKIALKNISCKVREDNILMPQLINNRKTDWNDCYINNSMEMAEEFRFKFNKLKEDIKTEESIEIQRSSYSDELSFYDLTYDQQIQWIKNSQSYQQLEQNYNNLMEIFDKKNISSNLTQEQVNQLQQQKQQLDNQIAQMKNNLYQQNNYQQNNFNYSNKFSSFEKFK